MANNQINEKTLVPIGPAVLALSALAGGIMWLSVMYANTQSNAASIDEVKVQQKDDRKEIMDRLNVMDIKLDRILRR